MTNIHSNQLSEQLTAQAKWVAQVLEASRLDEPQTKRVEELATDFIRRSAEIIGYPQSPDDNRFLLLGIG